METSKLPSKKSIVHTAHFTCTLALHKGETSPLTQKPTPDLAHRLDAIIQESTFNIEAKKYRVSGDSLLLIH